MTPETVKMLLILLGRLFELELMKIKEIDLTLQILYKIRILKYRGIITNNYNFLKKISEFCV